MFSDQQPTPTSELYTNSENVRVTRETIEIEGNTSRAIIVEASTPEGVAFLTDPHFTHDGIITEPGSALINQGKTAELYGNKPAGETPEQYLENSNLRNVIAMPGAHYGWQEKAFVIIDGQPLLVKNDQGVLSGDFPTLCMDGSGQWSMQTFKFETGTPAGNLEDVKFGMNGLAIITKGQSISLEEIASGDDPRVMADMRAVFDFANGNKVPGKFFGDIRGFSPNYEKNREAFVNLALGRTATFLAGIPENPEDKKSYESLMEMIASDSESVFDHLSMTVEKDKYALTIEGQIPEQLVPLIGWGCKEDGSLIAIAVDGRQEDSAGVSIRQLAELMVERGATDAILGCGGGDVAVIERGEDGTMTTLNSPSNPGNITRRVPNLMGIPL